MKTQETGQSTCRLQTCSTSSKQQTMTDSPRVTVIIATYSRADLLPRAVDSVLSQTFRDLELIIVDDCSTDDTPEVVAGFEGPRVCSFRLLTNQGQAAAFNIGLENARGEYVALLDDDDEWMPTKLEKQVAAIEAAAPGVAMVYCWVDRVDDTNGEVVHSYRYRNAGDIFDVLLSIRTPAPTSAWLVRTSAAREIGGFDVAVVWPIEIPFLSSLASRHWAACVSEVLVVNHTGHGHRQITSPLLASVSLQLDYINRHLARFEVELRQRPKCRSIALRRKAMTQMMTGSRLGALATMARSFTLDPVGTLGAILRQWRLAVSIVTGSGRG